MAAFILEVKPRYRFYNLNVNEAYATCRQPQGNNHRCQVPQKHNLKNEDTSNIEMEYKDLRNLVSGSRELVLHMHASWKIT